MATLTMSLACYSSCRLLGVLVQVLMVEGGADPEITDRWKRDVRDVGRANAVAGVDNLIEVWSCCCC